MKTAALLLLIVLCSCSALKTKRKRVFIDDLKKSNELYTIKNNSYFYFMVDSLNHKHLVRTHIFNSSKVIWIEPLTRN